MRFGVTVHYTRLCVVGQKVVVEFGTLELALEGSGRARVWLGGVAVVAGSGGSAHGLGWYVSAVDRRFRRKVVALDHIVPGRRSQGRHVWLGFRGGVRIWQRVHCKYAKTNLLRDRSKQR